MQTSRISPLLNQMDKVFVVLIVVFVLVGILTRGGNGSSQPLPYSSPVLEASSQVSACLQQGENVTVYFATSPPIQEGTELFTDQFGQVKLENSWIYLSGTAAQVVEGIVGTPTGCA